MFPFLVVFGAALFVASGYVLAVVAVAHGPALVLRAGRLAIRGYGVLFLWLVSPAWRVVARIGAIGLAAALAASAIVVAVSAANAGPLMREPGDVVYQPPFAIRADGRLALPPGMTPADAARAYAGPREYWASECPATLPGWRMVVDWQGVDAVHRPLWRAGVSGAGVVEVAGLGPAEADPLRAFLEELAQLVRCE
jgi:hypothetical protein